MGKEKERERNIDVREKHQCERETSIGCLPYMPRLGTKLVTQACALTRNQTVTFGLQDESQQTEPHGPGQ